MRNVIRFLVGSLVLVSSLSFADSVALTPGFPANVISQPGSNLTYGWQFTVTSPITVTGLGYFAVPLLLNNHEVGIFSSGGSLLLSATIPAGNYLNNVINGDDFAFVSVSSFTLADGIYVIAGGSFDSGDGAIYSASSLSTIPEITLGQTGLYASGSTFSFPTLTNPGGPFLGPNFEVESTTVPEPSSFTMLMCIAICCVLAFTLRGGAGEPVGTTLMRILSA